MDLQPLLGCKRLHRGIGASVNSPLTDGTLQGSRSERLRGGLGLGFFASPAELRVVCIHVAETLVLSGSLPAVSKNREGLWVAKRLVLPLTFLGSHAYCLTTTS